MTGDSPGHEHSRQPGRLRNWLAGWTLRARLIAGLIALFAVASVGVGFVTTAELSNFLLSRLDQQVNSAGQALSHSIEDTQGGGSSHGPDSEPVGLSCKDASQNHAITDGQALGTFAARLYRGQLSYACLVVPTGHGPGLKAVNLSAAEVATLRRLQAGRQAQEGSPRPSHPVTIELAALGDYRVTAFTGLDQDVHIAGLPTTGEQATVRRFEIVELVVFGSALAIMALLGTGLIRLSLRPLDRVTATAAEVSALPLESGEVALPHRAPEADARTEVGRLGRAFNRMLGNVEASLAKRQESEAKLRRFVADASHELRTPLAGIRGHTELALRRGEDLSPDVRTALGRVDAESARMSRLVDDLLLLARLDAGRPLAHEPVDLTKLAIDVTSDAQVAGPGHSWVLDLPEQPVVITGDQYRLHQVLANLLSNARTHTPPGSTVTVRLARSSTGGGEGAELTVSDNGPGIPPELQEQVWERFARADTARSRKAGSTGLGLAIVRAVVEAHQGTLVLASEPGNTTFRMWLPEGPGINPPAPAAGLRSGSGDGQAGAAGDAVGTGDATAAGDANGNGTGARSGAQAGGR